MVIIAVGDDLTSLGHDAVGWKVPPEQVLGSWRQYPCPCGLDASSLYYKDVFADYCR